MNYPPVNLRMWNADKCNHGVHFRKQKKNWQIKNNVINNLNCYQVFRQVPRCSASSIWLYNAGPQTPAKGRAERRPPTSENVNLDFLCGSSTLSCKTSSGDVGASPTVEINNRPKPGSNLQSRACASQQHHDLITRRATLIGRQKIILGHFLQVARRSLQHSYNDHY